MSRIISASINLEKIDKSRIKEGNNGTGKYYDIIIVVNDELDQYQKDTQIQQGQSKEEREAKATKVYLGNGKTIYNGSPATKTTPEFKAGDDNDDLPF
jgi:hypothetical protein